MYRDKKILAIIPARGGSKRLPRKNVLELAGKPLIAWTIEAAQKSSVFDEVMVNTDDPEIAEFAELYNAKIPFLRSKELGTDTASSIDVVVDTLKQYETSGKEFHIVVLLQPTSPLRSVEDIRKAIDLFIDKNASSVLSVCEVDHPVQWCNKLEKTNRMDYFIKKEYKGKRSQDLEQSYRINGAIFIWDRELIIRKKETILSPSYASIMPRHRSIDIDEAIDFRIAEVLIKEN